MPPSGNSLWRYVSKVFKTGGSKERNLRQGNLESLLDGLENLLVLLAADKGDTETLGTETTSTTDTMEVRVGITGKIVVDGKVNTLDIDTTTEDVSGDTDTLVELLELLVTLDTVGDVRRCWLCERNQGTYRSSWETPEWTAILGKLHSRRSLSSSVARRVLLTKMMTWLNSSSSSKSLSLRFFSASLSLM